MRVLSTDVYVGPNRYATFPCILQTIELGELEQWPTAKLGDAFIVRSRIPPRRHTPNAPRSMMEILMGVMTNIDAKHNSSVAKGNNAGTISDCHDRMPSKYCSVAPAQN